MTLDRLTRSATAALLAGAFVPGIAGAASFQILEQSPALQGTSFAGTASVAQDASTVFFNPAGMTQLDGRQFYAGGSLIQPTAEFNDNGSGPQTGPESTTDESAVVPNLYYVMPSNGDWTFGLGVSAPYGLSSSYDKDWVGRYHATDSELQLVNINPTFAYQANSQLSLGVGLNYQLIDATLENEVDSFAACVGATGDPGGCQTTGAPPAGYGVGLTPALRAEDSSAKITGDDDGFGLDLSLLYQITDQTRIGVLWRQGVEFTLDGSADFDQSTECQNNAGCSGALDSLEGDIKADLEIPDTLNVSVSHEVNDRWGVHGDIAWTGWSSIQKIAIDKDDGTNVSTLDLQYDDTFRYALGATYADGGPWTWRGGIALDEAPQSDPSLQTPRVPDGDRTWLSFGFNYAFSQDASLDFGYTHILVDDPKIDNTDDANHTLAGTFDADVDILAISGNWHF